MRCKIIGLAPITQVIHLHNRNSNIQGRSPNVVRVISIPKGTALKGKNLLPLGEKFPICKGTQLMRITACSSSLHLMCVTFQRSGYAIENFDHWELLNKDGYLRQAGIDFIPA